MCAATDFIFLFEEPFFFIFSNLCITNEQFELWVKWCMLLKQLSTPASCVHSLNQCQVSFYDVVTTIAGIIRPDNASRKEDCESTYQPLLEVIILDKSSVCWGI